MFVSGRHATHLVWAEARGGAGLGAVKNPRRTPASEILIARELGRDGRILEEKDVIRLLRSAIERKGDQGAFARYYGIDRGYLNLITNGKRPINKTVLKALGLRKVFALE